MFILSLLSGAASLLFQPIQTLAAVVFGPILSVLLYPWPLFLLISQLFPSS